MILLPLFALSGVLAYYLIKQIDKEEKLKQKKGITNVMSTLENIVHVLCM